MGCARKCYLSNSKQSIASLSLLAGMAVLALFVLCFSLGTRASQWTVGVGLQDQRSIYQSNIVHVSRIFQHEYFSQQQNTNDIALMKLSKRVDLTGRYLNFI